MSTTPRTKDGESDPRSRVSERSVAAAHRARSLESRAGSVLSFGIVCVLGVGLLAWYYTAALKRPARADERARAALESQARAEMALPPLPALESLGASRPAVRTDPAGQAGRAVPPRLPMPPAGPAPLPAPLPAQPLEPLRAAPLQPFASAQL
ncbi:MAG: hypothetical protein ACREUG_19040, partial [Steroidobacteraceae bacterium]